MAELRARSMPRALCGRRSIAALVAACGAVTFTTQGGTGDVTFDFTVTPALPSRDRIKLNVVAILERDVLTAGSSWHAAGGYHALNADPNIAALQAYTIDLLSEIGE